MKKKISISQEGLGQKKCIYCKKDLSVKFISHQIDDDLSEIIFLDSHRICSRNAMQAAFLKNEISETEKKLLKLRKRLTAFESKEIIKTAEVEATLN